ncbi:MAG TPA: EAL domain-containing protein [Bryobacteraceae bacterium]|nr:EAL domain-containing protein [Bryobacteraceae bacterium]
MPLSSKPFREHGLTVELQDALTEAPAGGAFPLIAEMGAHLFGAPMAVIGIVDDRGGWIHFVHGLPESWTRQNIAFLEAVLDSRQPLVVKDTCGDARFSSDLLVVGKTAVRFFAGVPLLNADGTAGGVFGILDTRPRDFNAAETELLRDLAAVVMKEIGVRLRVRRESRPNRDREAGAEQYRDLFENATDIVYTHDLTGRFTAVTKAVEFITGYSREEVLGMNVTDLVAPEQREGTRQRILEQIGGAPSDTYELVVLTKDGRRIILEANTGLLFKRGQPVGVQGFARDITERATELVRRRVAEAELQEKTNELARFSEHLRQLHRLSLTDYASLDALFADYLATGRRMFSAPVGIVVEGTGEHTVMRAKQPSGGLVQDRHAINCNLRYGISTPILIDGAPYGILFFGCAGPENPRIATAEEREVLELMAASIAHFLAKSRIEEERARDAALAQDVNRVLEMVGRNSSLRDTLSQLARTMERHAEGSASAILLSREGMLALVASAGLPEDLVVPLLRMELGQNGGFCGTAAAEGFSVVEEDLCRDRVLGPYGERFAELGFTYGCSAPILTSGGTALGVIAGFCRHTLPESLLETASRLAAIAIEQRQLTDRLAYQAEHDLLTGLPNRLYLMECLDRAVTEARARQSQLAVAFIDLDRFKQINDTLGHVTGDLLMQEVGARLRRLTPGNAALAKMGGDEFIAILSGISGEEEAAQFAQTILQALRAPYRINEHELFVTASIGVCLFPKDGDDARSLLRHADVAMYRAKKQGKNDVQFFRPQTGPTDMERLTLETQLRRALENDELELYYQPIMRIDGKLAGLEVLLAWNNPKLGRISPNQFIPIAEESGMIATIGAWVLRRACAQNAQWQRAGYPLVRLSVNVSALQFARADFVDTVAEALAESGLSHHCLELELTEGLVMGDVEESARRMRRLRELGVTMTIDDFGTGYSSLSYLSRLPVDALKIDRSFIQQIAEPGGSLPLIETIVALAHKMGLSVVAEGVETPRQLELLRLAGCDKVQGHLYGESVPGSAAELLLVQMDQLASVADYLPGVQ